VHIDRSSGQRFIAEVLELLGFNPETDKHDFAFVYQGRPGRLRPTMLGGRAEFYCASLHLLTVNDKEPYHSRLGSGLLDRLVLNHRDNYVGAHSHAIGVLTVTFIFIRPIRDRFHNQEIAPPLARRRDT